MRNYIEMYQWAVGLAFTAIIFSIHFYFRTLEDGPQRGNRLALVASITLFSACASSWLCSELMRVGLYIFALKKAEIRPFSLLACFVFEVPIFVIGNYYLNKWSLRSLSWVPVYKNVQAHLLALCYIPTAFGVLIGALTEWIYKVSYWNASVYEALGGALFLIPLAPSVGITPFIWEKLWNRQAQPKPLIQKNDPFTPIP